MADTSGEPGAPTPNPSTAPVPSKKEASSTSNSLSPNSKPPARSALVGVKQFDRLILRLNKLLSTPGGLTSSLSTLNYILYILTYLSPRLSKLPLLPSLFTPAAKPKPNNPGALPPVAALATLLAQTRTNLRLLGTFPLYAWLRTLIVQGGPKPGADPVLHRIALLQSSSYLVYQALENICVLADHGVVSERVIAALNRGDKTTARVYKVAYRAWLGGILCDFLRLGREAQIEGRRRKARRKLRADGHDTAVDQDEQDAKADRKWWSDFVIACAWLPMAAHFSSNAGIPGWNLGVMGICGLVAGGERIAGLWAATA